LILGVVVYWYSNHQTVVPRSIIFNYWWLSLVIIGGLRLCMRQYFMGDWFSAAQHVPFTTRDEWIDQSRHLRCGRGRQSTGRGAPHGQGDAPGGVSSTMMTEHCRSFNSGLQVYKPKHIQDR
jgi:hypothetical protein